MSKAHSNRSQSKESSLRSKNRDRYKRSRSKDHYRSQRSSSRSYIREYVSKPKYHNCSSSESSDSIKSNKHAKKKNNKGFIRDDIKTNLTQTRKSSSPECVIVDTTVVNEINEDKFTQKQFTSSKSKKVPDTIVIDLQKNTIKIPEVEQIEPDSIFHHNVSTNL